MADLDRKLFLGGWLKRLRYDLSLTQTQMAADLGVSASYLNHLERNQRPVTAQVLLKLAATYDLDLRTFTDDSEPAGEADLVEIFADPLFKDLHLPRREISELVASSPMAAEAVTRLYRAYTERRKRDALVAGPEETEQSPTDWVRDQIQSHHNFFPELDELGEQLFATLGGDPHTLEEAAQARLKGQYGIDIRLMPAQVMMIYQRRFDPHRRRLMRARRGDSHRLRLEAAEPREQIVRLHRRIRRVLEAAGREQFFVDKLSGRLIRATPGGDKMTVERVVGVHRSACDLGRHSRGT